MAESESRRPPLLMVLLLALLGVYAIPKATNTGSSSTPTEGTKATSAESASSKPASASDISDEMQTLRPLVEFMDHGDRKSETLDTLCAHVKRDRLAQVDCLISTIPDPIRTTNSYRFDDYLDAIQRAIESQGYVQDRYRFPWNENASADSTADAVSTRPHPDQKQAAVAEKAPAPDAKGCGPACQPGLIVFRQDSGHSLLLLFLVPESPTYGIEKAALKLSLDLTETILKTRAKETREIRILGPNFSGSQQSLEQALHGWLGEKDRATFQIRIISGSAGAIKLKRLEERFGKSVSFAASVHRSSTIVNVLGNYLSELVGAEEPIAVLQESNTGFGQRSSAELSLDGHNPIHLYSFPLHISGIRASYERSGLLRNRESEMVGSAAKLQMPLDESGASRDIIESKTPGMSAAIDELVLDQILSDLGRRRIKGVVIVATDSRDSVFLVREIRQFCPDAQIFTTDADLLFTHPQNIATMRGVLVGSTYPLYQPNQTWSYPFETTLNHVFFSSHGAQGNYNATLAHMREMHIEKDGCRFLEYGSPFQNYPDDAERRPPVWISVVGQRGIYPIGVKEPTDDDDYIYGLTSKHPNEATWKEDLEQPAHWWIFVLCLTLACGIVVVITILHSLWATGFAEGVSKRDEAGDKKTQYRWRRMFLDDLAEYLNWRRAQASSLKGTPRGPGFYLCIAIALLVSVYIGIIWPMLRASSVKMEYFETASGRWLLTMYATVYFTIWVMLAALVVSMTTVVLFHRDWLLGLIKLPKAKTPEPPVRKPKVPTPATTGADASASPLSATRNRGGDRRLLALLWIWGLVVGLLALCAHWAWLANHTTAPFDRFAFERAKLPSVGVSPTLPILLVGLAGGAWTLAQLKRRYILDQHTLMILRGSPLPSAPGGELSIDADTMHEIREHGFRFQQALLYPLRVIGRVGWSYRFAFWFFLLVFSYQGMIRWSHFPDDWVFEYVFGVLSNLLILAIVFHSFQLFVLWMELRTLLRLVARLSMLRAFDRIPVRVSRWFLESPKSSEDRFDLVRRQVDALAALSTSEVKVALDRAYPGAVSAQAWQELKTDLQKTIESKSEQMFGARDSLLPILFHCWARKPISATFAEPAKPSAAAGAAAGASEPTSSLPSEDPLILDEWTRTAEDLLALQLMRWLGPALNQLWTIIGFLVIGSVFLALALNSYPFPMRGTLSVGLGMMAMLVAVVIITALIGASNNELISRSTKSLHRKLDLDGTLVSGIVAYILPLIGLLAALSLGASDLIHTLLDPVIHILS